jgi:hypothetical protein
MVLTRASRTMLRDFIRLSSLGRCWLWVRIMLDSTRIGDFRRVAPSFIMATVIFDLATVRRVIELIESSGNHWQVQKKVHQRNAHECDDERPIDQASYFPDLANDRLAAIWG